MLLQLDKISQQVACIAGVCVRTQRPCLHLCDDVPAGWAQLPTWAGLAAAAAAARPGTRGFSLKLCLLTLCHRCSPDHG